MVKKITAAKNLETEDTASRIVHQATRLFLEKGYHGTSIDDITKAAGLTKGALYWYFKSKQDLLEKIVKEFENRFLNGLIQAVEETGGEIHDKFEKMFRYNAAFAFHNRELCVSFTTLAAELVGSHHGIETQIRRIYKKYQNFLSNLILQGKKEKIFKKDIDHKMAALIIMAFHDGILLHWSMNKDKVDGKTCATAFKKIIVNGLLS